MVERKIDRPSVEVLGAEWSTEGRLTTARVVGDSLSIDLVLLRWGVDRRSTYHGAVFAVLDQLFEVGGAGFDLQSNLDVATMLCGMYVGGSCKLQRHT